ncbi:hypothetical protein [Deinococcus sp.]|uniref:hypothetical protein n=1 Tax=Deinococcus sp. TaxID=47478 RepID=UPI003CC5478C
MLAQIGSLKQYSSIGEGASLLHRPGIAKAVAVKIDAVFEISTRVGQERIWSD